MLKRFPWIAALAAVALLTIGAPIFAAPGPIDINHASAAEFETLAGIGSAKAQSIVAFRDQNGPFVRVDDLQNVRGIGEKLLAALRPQLTIGGSEGDATE